MIQFTYEQEKNQRLSFLDVQLIRNDNNSVDTTVYRKPTDNNIYMRWDSFTPTTWRCGTLRSLLLRAYKICSTKQYRDIELNYIKDTFTNKHGYPISTVNKIAESIDNGILADRDDLTSKAIIMLKLPYKGKGGEKLVRSLNNTLAKLPTTDIVTRVIYNSTKLGSRFPVKDRTKSEHEHNLIYEITCPDEHCNASYIGETGRRLSERIKEHGTITGNSHVSQHSMKFGHKPVTMDNVQVLTKHRGTIKSRKTLESLYIKQRKPAINVQEASLPLKLF